MKLNQLLSNNNVAVFGFPALKELETRCNKNGQPAVLSMLSPAIMLDKGINSFYAVVMPRDSKFATADDIIAADLDIIAVTAEKVDEITADDNVLIVSRHESTIKILTDMYPHNTLLSGNATPDDIKGRKVVGTLPPVLAQYADAYKSAAMLDYNVTKDGDLSGEELAKRLIITDTIKVSVLEEKKMKRFEVIEDNGGGLTLVVFAVNGEVEYLHTGYENNPGQLMEDLEAIKAEENSVNNWDGNVDNPQELYEDITSRSYGWEIVADNSGIYPDKMGRAACLEFNISK